MTPPTDRPLDITWDAPLPHALTRTRTYLSTPSSSTQVAIIAVHGRGDNARDFAEAFVPHLRSYFGPHLLGEVEEDSSTADSDGEEEKGLKITLRALEARDGIWFGSHTPKTEDDLAFQGPYAHSSLLELRDEIESLHRIGLPHSKIVLVGFSQGAIIVNSYLLRALQLLCLSKHVKMEHGELVNSPLPIPAYMLGWAGTCFNFETTFPQPGWPRFPTPSTPTSPHSHPEKRHKVEQEAAGYTVWCHQQCGSSDRYFAQSDIEAVSSEISKAGERATQACSGLVVVKSTAEMERGAHSILPGMIAKLIQMVQAAAVSET
ncbi:uncharacterized protein UTRI_04778_B [Ustilago trichophora]|uniref:Uncharacterized protein n=1 Tax=Ustilago trichophora TaxID=86804 RepID=A0A5C3EIH7_9BASI|nr:uncharacterized protein UTRI_04778_B [Ustilago trichophora]